MFEPLLSHSLSCCLPRPSAGPPRFSSVCSYIVTLFSLLEMPFRSLHVTFTQQLSKTQPQIRLLLQSFQFLGQSTSPLPLAWDS